MVSPAIDIRLDNHLETPPSMTTSVSLNEPPAKAPIWWSNTIFFVGMHLLALVGITYLSPFWELRFWTFWLCFTSWQLATFGITVGYHRLWSHKAFTASFPLRVVLAGMGCLGFQGSIRWWVLRHRLHHRFTDSESDPYNAQEGLYHSHMGWIFRQPNYPRMALINKKDLDLDPVVRFQHKHYLPLTLGLGFVLPSLIGWTYGDALGGYIWGGIVARILIWHCTFLINSLAHALGDQAYSEDVSARGNFILALFTGGEANHNYHHAFPHDYRNGPRALDWDPTKWLIYILHHFTPLVPRVHQTPKSDILKARAHVLASQAYRSDLDASPSSSFALWSTYASSTSEEGEDDSSTMSSASSVSDDSDPLLESSLLRSRGRSRDGSRTRGKLPSWSRSTLVANIRERDAKSSAGSRPIVLLLSGYAVDVTEYASKHPGGVSILREYSVKTKGEEPLKDATEAFLGGVNSHGWSAREKMSGMRIARIV